MYICDVNNFTIQNSLYLSIIAYICQMMSRRKISNMMFTEQIRQLREHLQLPQRKLAEALDIDSATYCKIEKGERQAKKEQVIIISQVLQIDSEDLLSLWLADKVVAVVADEARIAKTVLKLVDNSLDKITYAESKAI